MSLQKFIAYAIMDLFVLYVFWYVEMKIMVYNIL